ncbi:MAG: hypothetical protein J0I06_11155 [Planctomycetes bacterium]|nr:hypothetical protein [Planctomycetota bacterium]
MSKQVLRNLELTTLLVALDHLEEYGPSAALPDPYQTPGECVYLAYIGEALLAALAARLPYADVLFRTPADGPRSKVVRKVFCKSAILHVLRFSFPIGEEFVPFVRDLGTVNQKRWSVLDAEGKPVRRARKGKNANPS